MKLLNFKLNESRFKHFKKTFEKQVKVLKAYLETFSLDEIVITLFLSDSELSGKIIKLVKI
jgi:hypothetical protein